MPNTTIFDPTKRYIFLPVAVATPEGEWHEFDALLDTGAPATEFSDDALQHIGLLKIADQEVQLPSGQQTKKYGHIIIPNLEVCSHRICDLRVFVSHFEKSWGIKALIGLDFFRRFRTTIDYHAGRIITEPYQRKGS